MAIFSLISGVVSAVSGFIGGLGVVGSFLLKTAVGVGLSLLAQSLAGKPKDPTFSINGTLQGGGDISRSFILGRTATAGSLVFVNTWGQDGDTPNAYLTQVIVLSDMPVRGLAEVWVNGERATLGALTDRGYSVNEYPDSLWVKFYDGTQTTADSFLFTSVSNGNRWWNPDRIGRGVAYSSGSGSDGTVSTTTLTTVATFTITHGSNQPVLDVCAVARAVQGGGDGVAYRLICSNDSSVVFPTSRVFAGSGAGFGGSSISAVGAYKVTNSRTSTTFALQIAKVSAGDASAQTTNTFFKVLEIK